jgi:seryl-tRNA synthetase
MCFCIGSTEAAAELRKELQSLRSRVESLEQELKSKDEEMKRVCKQQSLPIDQVSLQGRSQDERCKVNLDIDCHICSQHD